MKKVAVFMAMVTVLITLSSFCFAETRVKGFTFAPMDSIVASIQELAWGNKILDVSLTSDVNGHTVWYSAIVLYETN